MADIGTFKQYLDTIHTKSVMAQRYGAIDCHYSITAGFERQLRSAWDSD